MSSGTIKPDAPPEQIGLPAASRLLAMASAGWSLLAFSVVYFKFLGVLNWPRNDISPPSFDEVIRNIPLGGGYYGVALFLILMHGIALRATRLNPNPIALMLVTGVMGVGVFLTRFTIGVYLLLSTALLLVATILSILSRRWAKGQ